MTEFAIVLACLFLVAIGYLSYKAVQNNRRRR
jgi:hypothetical protein